jgi:hypothetical protein
MITGTNSSLPESFKDQGSDSNSSTPETEMATTDIPVSDVPVALGIGRCRCGGTLLIQEEDGRHNTWHRCEHAATTSDHSSSSRTSSGLPSSGLASPARGGSERRSCRFRIYCPNPQRCVLPWVLRTPDLAPCKFGHLGSWVLRRRRGRMYDLMCYGPGLGPGHQVRCNETLRHWRGGRPNFVHQPTDNPHGKTVYQILRAMLGLQQSATVGEIAVFSGLPEKKTRSGLRRMARSATPFVQEVAERTWDPRSRRHVMRYELTREGYIQAEWELHYGRSADGAGKIEEVEEN